MIVQHRHEFCIVSDENETIATATVFFRPDGLYISNVWVHAKHRRKGLATKIIQAVLDTYGLQDLYLGVFPFIDQPMNEEELMVFYQKFGFGIIGPMGLMKREGRR